MNAKKCIKCKKESTWTDHTNQTFCENHFLELIEKRIRKNLRINKTINIKNKEQEYYLKENKENTHLITKYFLKKIFQDKLKITNKEKKEIISSKTLNDEAEELLNFFMNKKEITKQEIKPLNVITDEELKKIAEILNIKITIKPKKHEELTKKDPQILFSTLKSKEFIEQRLRKK
ncbi:hypothetical protein KO361_03925 [Candidatus Woesearchaeota archaeon]|nr:hypothetical protein [Candidatus Woesearchaeota archaeon]